MKKTIKKKIKVDNFTSIYDVMGHSPTIKKNFNSVKEYQAYLRAMNLVDLQTHAIASGFKPQKDRAQIEKSLVNNYIKTQGMASVRSSNTENPDKVNKVLELLERAR